MTEERQTAPKTRWQLYAAVFLIVVVVIAVAGQWWINRPKHSAEHFIAVLSKQKINDATEMLADRTAIQSDTNGKITIKATDGSSATLKSDELPLIALGVPDAKPRDGAGDYVVGRYRFQLATSGPAVQNGNRKLTEIYCVADGNRIIVESVRQ
jgi:hypothetical protein